MNLDLKRNPRNKRRDRSESGGATADPHAGHTQSLSRRDARLPAAPRAASPAGSHADLSKKRKNKSSSTTGAKKQKRTSAAEASDPSVR